MHFELSQRFAAPASDVAQAFADPALYEALASLPKLGAPEVLDRTTRGDIVHLRVRYQFAGELSAAVKAVVDPAKLTWIDDSRHDLARRTVTFTLQPDHYADRFRAEGSYRFEPASDDPGSANRTTSGELKVRMLLVGGQVERAILSGLREHQQDEVLIVERWLRPPAV